MKLNEVLDPYGIGETRSHEQGRSVGLGRFAVRKWFKENKYRPVDAVLGKERGVAKDRRGEELKRKEVHLSRLE